MIRLISFLALMLFNMSEATAGEIARVVNFANADSDIIEIEESSSGRMYLNYFPPVFSDDEAECEGDITSLYAHGDRHSFLDGRVNDSRYVFLSCGRNGAVAFIKANDTGHAKFLILKWNDLILRSAARIGIRHDLSTGARQEAIASFDSDAAKIARSPQSLLEAYGRLAVSVSQSGGSRNYQCIVECASKGGSIYGKISFNVYANSYGDADVKASSMLTDQCRSRGWGGQKITLFSNYYCQ